MANALYRSLVGSASNITAGKLTGTWTGFPGAVRCANGDWLVAAPDGNNELAFPYTTAFLRSTDDGATWTNEGANGWITDCSVFWLTLLPDGDLLLTGVALRVPTDGHFWTYLARSTDHGHTWTTPTIISYGTLGTDNYRIAYGGLLEATNGDLIVSFARNKATGDIDTIAARSTDGGATWTQMAVIASTSGWWYDEPVIVRLADGRLACFMRTSAPPQATNTDLRIYTSLSSDDGYTWTTPTEAFRQAGGRPIVAVAPDGAVICAYRDHPVSTAAGVTYFRQSLDDCATWSSPVQIGTTGYVATYGQPIITNPAGGGTSDVTVIFGEQNTTTTGRIMAQDLSGGNAGMVTERVAPTRARGVPITDEFDSETGEFTFYDTNSTVDNTVLRGRKHTDIRSFYSDVISVPYDLFHLDMLTIDEMNNLTIDELEGDYIFRPSEPWTVGATGPDVAYGRRNTLRLSCTTGTNVTTSVSNPADLSNYEATDFICLTLPDYPGTKVNKAASFLELTQGGTTISLSFQNAPTSDGNTALMWPLENLGSLTQFDTVTLRIVVTANCTLTVGGLRAMTASWSAAKLDMDTRTQRLVSIFEKDGSIPTEPFPLMWRATEEDPGGSGDPRPINARLSTTFFTGNFASANKLSHYFRARREDFLTQLDLDGQPQNDLDALDHQPDYGLSIYDPRPMSDLNALTQSELDALTQGELERLSDTLHASWIEVHLHFGTTNQLEVGTTETSNPDDRYFFDIDGLASQTEYFVSFDLEDNSLRVKVYEILGDGGLGTLIFDSGAIIDDFLIKRRKGRVGWQFTLEDGDAWIEAVHSRGMMYGEVITNNLESLTPVEGARLFIGGTPNLTFEPHAGAFNGAILAADNYNAQSPDGAVKVTANPAEGIQTGMVTYEDFGYAEIIFDLFYPANGLKANEVVVAGLQNSRGHIHPLVLPTLAGDQWQTVRIPLTSLRNQPSGAYRFLLYQQSGIQTWWVDNLYVRLMSLAWSGRATLHDAWNRDDNRWTEFRNLVNSEVNGVIFPERGKWCQVRGRALTQEARIDKVYVKPQYAQLGRFVWNS